MDTLYGRRTAGGGRKTIRRAKRPGQQTGIGDQRRLIQLLVSLALFLLVYLGRGVFPAQFEAWRAVMDENIDFTVAFQEFGQAVAEGDPLGTSLESLWMRILGEEPDEPEKATVKGSVFQPVVLLGETPGAGRAYLSTHGVMEGRSVSTAPDEPDPPASPPPEAQDTPAPEPTQPTVVTAVAQEYTDDGVKLPSNVSFAFYELGLPKTVDPVTGPVTSTFGYRDSPVNGKNEFHLALDIGAAEGTEIGAFADGVVEYIGKSDEFGLYLKITHANNVSSFYAHCSKLLVHKGDPVTCGQTVALVGQTGNATGPHLHLTIEKDRIRLDPAYYVGKS